MDTLFSAFITQSLMCAALFVLLYYFVRKNGDLKEQIDSLEKNK